MKGFGGFGFSSISNNVKKKRTSRRPRSDSQHFSDNRDVSSLSSTPPSDNGGRCSEGVLAPANWKQSTNREVQAGGRICSTSNSGQSAVASDGSGNENKLKKVKLKVGGVTRTIHAQSASDGTSVVGSSSTKSSCSMDVLQPGDKLILQDNVDYNYSPSLDKRSGLRGVPWKDFPGCGFTVGKSDPFRGRKSEESFSMKQGDKYEAIRKSKRVPKRRILEGAFDDGDDDEEIRYLEKLRNSKVSVDYGVEDEDDEEEGSKKQRKISRVLKRNVDGLYNIDVGNCGSSKSAKEGKKSRQGRAFEDTDYVEEEEPISDGELEIKRKKPRKEFIDSLGDSKKEMAITTRQRALQTGKDISTGLGASLIEFPNGLPPAPPRKQKEKLSELEQQLKKAEAAQRRRMQVEKAARESEAEAIRKILGQDSSRKKREDKIKKRQEELAQERAASAMKLSSNTVRWTLGPTGTVVTFPNEMGLPSIFDSKSCSYPPPREKCAGPSCMNPYKYRDSKSKLPLCSLQCYKAIHEKMQSVTTSAC
ncbi:uncharacterized protein LOC131152671 isoform X2 [Malania oleifera]|uniref:uncharacterized protein LOC131152671 isoform X2 n=1 Tax=Malania oleifera TaxID=397392 RepID=UPI0025AE1C71|nr:uncharacterized protein LOC131152671 isoform X2 [Malania oleifera]XP_057960450.1 uncharacterized protein LOC131152671 isoform X2 [Malania oleifera]